MGCVFSTRATVREPRTPSSVQICVRTASVGDWGAIAHPKKSADNHKPENDMHRMAVRASMASLFVRIDVEDQGGAFAIEEIVALEKHHLGRPERRRKVVRIPDVIEQPL